MELCYINRKGKRVDLTITGHARLRFVERYNKIFPEAPILDYATAETTIENWWKNAVLKINKTKQLKERIKKYGDDSMYFISTYFVFVVQNKQIVTIEIGARNKKHLNRGKGVMPPEKMAKEEKEWST